MMRSSLVDITVTIKRETEKAWLINDGGKADVWLPKSQCEMEQNRDGKTWTATMEEWLATEKRLA
jgi:hypothetical protein